MRDVPAVHLSQETVEGLTQHMFKLRSVWMMSAHQKLNTDERRMLMEAIEAVDAALEDADTDEDH
jgi:hypothetical protein